MTTRPPERLILDRLPTPIGVALLVFDEQERLRVLYWEEHRDRMLELLRRHYGISTSLKSAHGPENAMRGLECYFAGDIAAIDAIECRTVGTPFQQKVWAALRSIPAGQTMSYGSLASKLGMPKAARAVGLANGSNPISVVVPCHRVIGSDNTLTGYGGGIERKRWLLTHEGAFFADRNGSGNNRRIPRSEDTPTLFAVEGFCSPSIKDR